MNLKQMFFGVKRDPRLQVYPPQYNPNIPVRAFTQNDPGIVGRMFGPQMSEEDAYLQGLISQTPERFGGAKSISPLMEALNMRKIFERMNQLKASAK